MKLLYYLAAIGEKEYKLKQKNLFNNLEYLSKQVDILDIILNIYDQDYEFESKLKNCEYVSNCYIYNKKGILTELFLTNPHNTIISNYDYILFTLDDIQIINLNIIDIIKIKEQYKLDIISPKIINSTHKWIMEHFDNSLLRIVNAAEFYLYIMKPKDFIKMLSVHQTDNRFMWGVDFMLGFLKFKTGIYGKYACNHLFSNVAYSNTNVNAGHEMIKFIKKYNFTSFNDITNKWKPIIKDVKIV